MLCHEPFGCAPAEHYSQMATPREDIREEAAELSKQKENTFQMKLSAKFQVSENNDRTC